MQKNNTPYDHTIFMQRCLELASNGLGWVAPNPMVGAVVVYGGKIVGEGYHKKYGQAHAEVNAIHAVKEVNILTHSTLYVNLEPCAHSGKTPPCTDLIIQKRIPRVVIGTLDPNSLVAGKGIQKLKAAGVEVITDVLSEECYSLNKRFFTFHEKKRPYIILKWAQTKDGFIDIERMPQTPVGIHWITSEHARKLVHKWRAEEQAILVGTETVLLDDPQLTLRGWHGKGPVRIIPDRELRIPQSAKILDGSVNTLIYNSVKERKEGKTEWIKMDLSRTDFKPVLDDLFLRGISSVIVEGGKRILDTFLLNDLWDEARVFTGNICFEKGVKSPDIRGQKIMEVLYFGDVVSYYKPVVP